MTLGIATQRGVPRSTARGWPAFAPTAVVSLDVVTLTEETMTIFDRIATDAECLAPVGLTPRAKRQRIGALLLAYGTAEGALLGWLSLMGLQASDGTEPWLRPTLLALSTPWFVACVGLGLAGDRRWAYWAALLLPIAIVPVGGWWIMNPRGRPERLWVEFLGSVGAGAFLALGTVALSAALLFITYQDKWARAGVDS